MRQGCGENHFKYNCVYLESNQEDKSSTQKASFLPLYWSVLWVQAHITRFGDEWRCKSGDWRQTPSGHAAVPNDSLSSAHISADIAGRMVHRDLTGAVQLQLAWVMTLLVVTNVMSGFPRVHVYDNF